MHNPWHTAPQAHRLPQVLEPEDKTSLAHELADHVLACMGSQHGNHVIQKLIECVQPSDALDFVTQVRAPGIAWPTSGGGFVLRACLGLGIA